MRDLPASAKLPAVQQLGVVHTGNDATRSRLGRGRKLYDLICRNGVVADGTGGPLFPADVAIARDRIAAVGKLDAAAARVIDASGMVIAPGFVDIHSHTDVGLLANPPAESKLTQGITTEVGGNCGTSPGPCLDESVREELRQLRADMEVSEDWTTLGEFLLILETHGIAVNYATYVGHSNVRSAVVGLADVAASPGQIEEMRELVDQAMREGAIGISSGLIYAPSCYGDTDELAALAEAARPCGGIYASHIRNEREGLLDAVAEAIEVGRRSGAAVQIAHHKACGRNNRGKVKDSLEMIGVARRQGVNVTVDQYPYIASATSLSAIIPRWAHDGGPQALLERLKSPDRRAEIAQWLRDASAPGGPVELAGGWPSVVVSSVKTEANKDFEGKHIGQVAELAGKEAVEALLDLLIEEELAVAMVHFTQCEEDVRTVLASSHSMFGTDASARARSGPLSKGKPHPRAYGTFPRILARYVREEGVLDLPTAIMKMTSIPAAKAGLDHRGRIAPGWFADIVVFDPESIEDRATYADPHQVSAGIAYVIVNGEVAAEAGEVTGTRSGRVLRGSGARALGAGSS